MNGRTLIVFDMDGVLIDVSRSYRETVRRTARLFFKGAQGWNELPDPLFPLSDLGKIKLLGNLNNDWDLSFAVISLLCSLVVKAELQDGSEPWERYFRTVSLWNVEPLARYLRTQEEPLTTLFRETRESRGGDLVGLFYTGEVGQGNLIKQIFQELYLGGELFRNLYGTAPRVHGGAGCIEREELLADRETLRRLSVGNDLAVATGRPRLEAEYSLERLGIAPLFEVVLTLDDCLAEERRILEERGKPARRVKPHPYMLEQIARRGRYARRYYVGDMPDDMIAAAKARFVGVGIASSVVEAEIHRSALRESGAKYLVETLNDLEALLSPAG